MYQPLPLDCRQLVAVLPHDRPVRVSIWLRTLFWVGPMNWSFSPSTTRSRSLVSVRLPLPMHDVRLKNEYWTPSPMPHAAWTRLSEFLASVAITAPWLNPPTTTPLLQSALARAHSTDSALVELAPLKMQRALPEIWLQLPNAPLLYAMVAATNPRLAMAATAAVADALVNVSLV